jgi:4-hydroxy-tetrahydrodipicolinate synthase
MSLFGIIPPMTTPFDENEDIDTKAVGTQVDWLLGAGVHGICFGGSTGEGHALDRDDLRVLGQAVVESVDGRVPVICGLIVDSTREAVLRAGIVEDLDLAALQVTPVHYLFTPSDEAVKEHFRIIAEASRFPVLIYNVVPWSYLSAELLLEIIHDVPGVIGVKQSNADLHTFADLKLGERGGDVLLAATDALLYPAFRLGAKGAIAATLAAAPKPTVRLWDAVQAGDDEEAAALHRKLLPLWNACVGDNMPSCIKYAQSLQGVATGTGRRRPMHPVGEEQKLRIRSALEGLGLTDQAVA